MTTTHNIPAMTASEETPPTEATSTRRVLVVEDEEALAIGVKDALEHAKFEVAVVHDGAQALERIRADKPDLIVLDLMLPSMSGLEILEKLRGERITSRVLILTALADEEDLVRGFEMGADDYLKKPFSPRELVARVEAQFRRVEMDTAPPQFLELPDDIRVDLQRLEVHRDGKTLALTPREGDILAYLIQHRDRVVTREDLLLDVWHYQSANVETRTVDIHIVGLRRKVEPNPSEPTLIQTVRGKGYRWYS
ncbi:MAG: response regulator transcription factor [bacterium]|nr:response regulator transcription factor [bacterium]